MTKRDRNNPKLRDSWILCFILGVVMINYPFIHIFNKTTFYFGMPLLFLYFFIGWPLSIGVIFLFSRIIDDPAGEADTDQDLEKEDS